MIIARIESLILEKGIEDAIDRSKTYIDGGVDGIMIHSKKEKPNEIFEFSKIFRKNHKYIPLVSVPSTYNSVKEEELIKHGFNIVIYANQMLRAAYPAMYKVAESILKNGRSLEADKELIKIKNILELIPEQSSFMKDLNMKIKNFVHKKQKNCIYTRPGKFVRGEYYWISTLFWKRRYRLFKNRKKRFKLN